MSSEKDTRVKSLLTNREREVFELLVQDKTTKEIASQLFVSEKTVRNHISNDICSLTQIGTSRVESHSSFASFCQKSESPLVILDFVTRARLTLV